MFKRDHELRSGDEVLATLTWPKALGTLAEGTIDGTKYTLKRGGFLHPYVTVRKVPFEEDVARMELTIGGHGTLQFPDGTRYSFQKLSFWGFKWGMMSESGDPLVTFGQASALKSVGEMSIEPAGAADRHLPILVLLGGYTVILAIEENRTAATAVVVTG